MFKKNSIIFITILIITAFAVNVTAAQVPEFMGGEAERILNLDHVRIIPFTESGITDFNESPKLAEKVEEGVLPPVAERLPANPMVVEVEEEIGNYGGNITFTQFGPESLGISGHIMTEPPLLINRDFSNVETIPNFAKDWKYSDDGQTFTLYLREGVRWSDGEELTTEDLMFWYEDILLNEELTAAIPREYRPGGVVMEVEAIDDYTAEFTFDYPYYSFHQKMNSSSYSGLDLFVPSHYLQEFHIDYNDEANELAQDEGFDDWVVYFENRNSWEFSNPVPVGRPVLSAWMPVNVTPTGRVYERNPYYFKVDSEGNQLPYIDTKRTVYTPDAETRLMNILAGEIDYISSFLSFADYPTIVANEDTGNYDAWIGESMWGNEVNLTIQQQPIDDKDMWDVLGDVRFRQALSLAIDREEIKELVFMGQGEIRQNTYNPGLVENFKEEWATSYTEYDPGRAEELLDEMGIVDQNGDGWRQKTNGENLMIQLLTNSSRAMQVSVAEMAESFWEDIGIRVNMNSVEEGLFFGRMWGGEFHVATHNLLGYLPPNYRLMPQQHTYFGYYNWFLDYDPFEEKLMVDEIPEERADLAIEPPEEYIEWFTKGSLVDHVSPEERKETFEKIGDLIMEKLPIIGTVGMAGHVGISKRGLRNVRKVGDNPSVGATRNAFLEQSFWENPDDN